MSKSKKNLIALSTVTLFAGSANAALPAEVDTAITAVMTFATDMISAAWPIVATITVGLVGITLFKKFVSRAT